MNEIENSVNRTEHIPSPNCRPLGYNERGNASVSCATCIWILPACRAGGVASHTLENIWDI